MKIQYLYETHLECHDLDVSIAYYEKLGLRLGQRSERAAFMWIGDSNEQMLGLWLSPRDQPIDKVHFAFHVSLDDLLNAKEWLAERGIELIKNKGFDTDEAIIHAWMPAASVYFNDPDGNKLEFISVLPEKPQQLGYRLYLSEWNKIKESME